MAKDAGAVLEKEISPEQYEKYLSRATEEAGRAGCQSYLEALPISKRDKARLYEQSIKLKKHGRAPKNNPFA